MPKSNYAKTILDIIEKGKAASHWSISDYLNPIRELYAKLSLAEREVFRLAVIELLHGEEHLDNVLDICRELHLKEACPMLVKLLRDSPRYQEDGYPVWVEGFRRRVVVTLGQIGCHNALSLLAQVVESKIAGRRSKQLKLDEETYGTVIQALTDLSPADAAKYLGWWIDRDQQLRRKAIALMKQTDDWKKLQTLGVSLPIDERASSVLEHCILTVVKREKLQGLKNWLRSITLLHECDRDYLQHQLERVLSGENPLADLRSLLNFKGDPKSLAGTLASLPAVRK